MSNYPQTSPMRETVSETQARALAGAVASQSLFTWPEIAFRNHYYYTEGHQTIAFQYKTVRKDAKGFEDHFRALPNGQPITRLFPAPALDELQAMLPKIIHDVELELTLDYDGYLGKWSYRNQNNEVMIDQPNDGIEHRSWSGQLFRLLYSLLTNNLAYLKGTWPETVTVIGDKDQGHSK